jgi:hypothetical protein
LVLKEDVKMPLINDQDEEDYEFSDATQSNEDSDSQYEETHEGIRDTSKRS